VACVLTAINLGLRVAFGVPTLPELALDAATLVLPLPLFEAFLRSGGGLAKPLGFGALFLAQIALGAIVGALINTVRRPKPRAAGVEPDEGTSEPRPWLETRRHAVERIAWASTVGIAAFAGWRAFKAPRPGLAMGATPGSRPTRRPPDGLAPDVTPNADFYTVSKNLIDPHVELARWQLQVGGLVNRTLALTYDELRALPQAEQWQTLFCISNEVGGEYAGNALWGGVRLMDLLRAAGGVQPGARDVVLRASDGYADSVPLAKAADPATLVALTMNGVPLPPEHGAPARLLVPGTYGVKNVKWLTAVEVIAADFRGYWQQRGWSEDATVKTTARIDTPRKGSAPAATVTRVAGVAFAGDRGISAVELSLDSGTTWQTARLSPPKGPLSWVPWELPWSPPPGDYQLTVRAVDGHGQAQTAQTSASLPDGAAGYHRISVRVT
jgi:DMSO/TMAO reductase YedYZ molybdopterin-dependent catalytic subunit